MKKREEIWNVKRKKNLEDMIENKKKAEADLCVFKPSVV